MKCTRCGVWPDHEYGLCSCRGGECADGVCVCRTNPATPKPKPKAPAGRPKRDHLRVVKNQPDEPEPDDDLGAKAEAAFAAVLARAIPAAEPPPTPPVVVADFAGLPLLHAGELTFLYGHPKSGKSWATLAMAKQTVEAGGRVLMICWERVESTRRRRHRITRHDHAAYHGWAVVPHTEAGTHLDRWIGWLDEAPVSSSSSTRYQGGWCVSPKILAISTILEGRRRTPVTDFLYSETDPGFGRVGSSLRAQRAALPQSVAIPAHLRV